MLKVKSLNYLIFIKKKLDFESAIFNTDDTVFASRLNTSYQNHD